MVCECHFMDAMPCSFSWIFLFSSPFVYILFWSTAKMVLSVLGRGTAQLIIPLKRVQQKCFVSSYFLALLIYLFFFHFPLFLSLLSIWPSICRFPFLRAFWQLVDLVNRLFPLWDVCQFSFLAWCIFLCPDPFLYLDCIVLQFVLEFTILFRFNQKVCCCLCKSSGWSFPQIH